VAALAAAGLAGIQSARADTVYWYNTTGDNQFSTPGNWSGSTTPPGASDTALFGVVSVNPVQFTSDETNAQVESYGGVTSLDMGAHTYNVTSTGGGSSASIYLTSAGSLTVSGGTLSGVSAVMDSGSTLGVSGTGATLSLSGGGAAGYGSAGTLDVNDHGSATMGGSLYVGGYNTTSAGTLDIKSQGALTTGSAYLGSYSNGSTGTATVDNATWTTGQLTIGGQSNGALTATNGATINSTLVLMATAPTSTSTATITSNSTWTATTALYIGGYGSTQGTATVNLGDGGKIDTSTMEVEGTSTVNLQGDSTVTGQLTSNGGTVNISHGNNNIGTYYYAGATTTVLLSSATDYGQLHAGTAILGAGTLDVLLDTGFNPAPGDTFTLFTAGNYIHNAFSTVNLPTLNDGLSWNIVNTDEYIGSYIITVVPEPTMLGLAAAGGLLLLRRRR
jgi:T5SS/PEP-CTERM-associated repeat protein